MIAQIYHAQQGWVLRKVELAPGVELSEVPVREGAEFAFRWETAENADTPVGAPMDRTDLRGLIALRRWEEETGGVEVNGVMIRTDRESQAMITGALALATRNPSVTFPWKTESGFVQLSAAQIGGVAEAVGQHVQNCFAREAELIALVDQADPIADREFLQTLVNAFWPIE